VPNRQREQEQEYAKGAGMRVLGISGSPRRDGNTDILVNTALEVLAGEGLQTDFLSLADRPIKPCVACRGCFGSETIRCV
jgi:multimeric flavodoxin WrbA